MRIENLHPSKLQQVVNGIACIMLRNREGEFISDNFEPELEEFLNQNYLDVPTSFYNYSYYDSFWIGFNVDLEKMKSEMINDSEYEREPFEKDYNNHIDEAILCGL